MIYPPFLPAEGTFSTPGAVSATGRPLAIGCDVLREEMTVATYNPKKTTGSFGMEDRTDFYRNILAEQERVKAEEWMKWFDLNSSFSLSVDHVARAIGIIKTRVPESLLELDTRVEIDKTSEGRYIWVDRPAPVFQKPVEFKPMTTIGPIKSSLVTGMFQGAFHWRLSDVA